MPRAAKSSADRWIRRDSSSGRLVGVVDEADARAFRKASRALSADVGRSKEKAIEVLKASGYLTPSGKVSKRYR
jgi:hypothetical protein